MSEYMKFLLKLLIIIICINPAAALWSPADDKIVGSYLDFNIYYDENLCIYYLNDDLLARDIETIKMMADFAIQANVYNNAELLETINYKEERIYHYKIDGSFHIYSLQEILPKEYWPDGICDTFETATKLIDYLYHAEETLTAQTGSISVSSNPSGANVYLDRIYKGTTPTILSNVPIGPHTVKFTKSGYNDVIWPVTVSLDQTASHSTEMSVHELLVITGASLLLALLFIGIILKKSRKSSDSAVDATTVSTPKPNESKKSSISTPASTAIAKDNTLIKTTSAFSYKGATIQYKIKVENPTSEPIGDIKVNLYVPDVFLVSESTKTIVMLKPDESKTVTFEIRPTGECGDCEVSGKVVYYDYSTRKTSDIEIPAKNLSIVCPMLRVKEISESEWHNIVGNFVETEESTKDIDMPAETLFTMVSRIVKDMHMHPLNPEITDSPQLYNGVSRFYGEGVKGLKYAAQVEVVGGAKKSKLILKTWAEKEEALTGFYHGLLDEIEKRVHVKEYIDDSIVQNFHHHGDNIGTQVKDSFVYKSNVGTGARKCPNCGREVDSDERFCQKCGEKL